MLCAAACTLRFSRLNSLSRLPSLSTWPARGLCTSRTASSPRAQPPLLARSRRASRAAAAPRAQPQRLARSRSASRAAATPRAQLPRLARFCASRAFSCTAAHARACPIATRCDYHVPAILLPVGRQRARVSATARVVRTCARCLRPRSSSAPAARRGAARLCAVLFGTACRPSRSIAAHRNALESRNLGRAPPTKHSQQAAPPRAGRSAAPASPPPYRRCAQSCAHCASLAPVERQWP